MKTQKNKKILLINICKEKLHYFEFVKPLEDILKKEKINFITEHYLDLNKSEFKKFDKIIICGTSLKDNHYLDNLDYFTWIKDPEFSEKSILGICAGMQIISLVFNANKTANIKNKKEIGFYSEFFKKDFLNIKKGKQSVYHLHKNYIEVPKEFEKFTDSKIPQTIKHKSKNIYGVLFHPEVRQKDLIKEFVK
jgi:GMP synthase (glutamine-hydrolysing)